MVCTRERAAAVSSLRARACVRARVRVRALVPLAHTHAPGCVHALVRARSRARANECMHACLHCMHSDLSHVLISMAIKPNAENVIVY